MPRSQLNRFPRLLQWILIVLVPAGCSSKGVGGAHSFSISTEGGTIRAVSNAVPRYSEPLFEYERVITLLEDDQIEESLLYRPSGIMMDEEGYFYVTNFGDGRIVVFDPRGEYHHSFGRKGQGPGEFENPNLLSVRDGIVTIFDFSLNRASLFRTDGTFLRTITHVASTGGIGMVSELHPGPDGTLILLGDQPRDTGIYRPDGDSYRARRATVVSADGDTLCILDTPKVVYGRRFILEQYGVGSVAYIYCKGTPVILYRPGRGLLMSTGEEPVLRWYDLDGSLKSEITIDMEREEVTAEERAAIIETSRRIIDEAPDGRWKAMYKRQHELMKIPDTKDFWTRVQVDDSGFIWLQKMTDYAVPAEERQRVLYVVSPEGEYLGETTWPARSGTLSYGHFLVLETDDETGAETGVVYLIKPAVAGLDYP